MVTFLMATRRLRALELDDSVDQQKRVAVGEETQDLLDVEGHSWLQSAIGGAALRSTELYRRPRRYFLMRRSAASTLQKSAGNSWL